MARYRVLEKSFINNRLVQPGEEIDYDGEASANLQRLGAGLEEAKPEKRPGKGKEPAAPLV